MHALILVDLQNDFMPGGALPVHCVQDTPGAQFVAGLDRSRIVQVFRKAIDPTIDSYSGFYDNGHRRSTQMGEYLSSSGVDEVTIAGLATDYCVLFTALDGRGLGLKVNVLAEGCRGVNLAPDDSDKALEKMRAAGVTIL
jgi:nicotinamidase/pyrazinamidase